MGLTERIDIQKKIAFLKTAVEKDLNVVELLLPWVECEDGQSERIDPQKLKEAFLSLEVSDNISEDKGGGHFVTFRNQVQSVIDSVSHNIPASINFSDLRHDVIAEIIHDFVYKNGRPIYAPVIYSDGSEARPFPLQCLRVHTDQSLSNLRKQPILNVGMMSARHSNDGLDPRVKVYWFRNQEISIGRTQAETDEVAYKKSKERLLELRPEGSYRIAFYQTGFQPAIVGFYRALVEELIFWEKKPAKLEVTPYYFMGGDYKIGKTWG
jgi:hypothetical protein